jgi:hypothetical protein
MTRGLRPLVAHWIKTTVQGCNVALDKLQRAACLVITAPTAAVQVMFRLEPSIYLSKGKSCRGHVLSAAPTEVTLGI